MKITANRRDEIIKQRDEYEADYSARSARHEEQSAALRKAEYEVLESVQARVAAELSDISQGAHLEIIARRGWNYRSEDTVIEIQVRCNESFKFDDSTALSWDWSVKLDDDGNVIRDSGSWSGLKACTPEQLDDLQRSLNILRRLNDMDWGTILSTTMPRYADYVTERAPYRNNRPDFEQMLFDIDIEEAIGKPVLMKGAGDYSNMWFSVLKQTDKQYTVIRIPNYAVQNPAERGGMSIEELIAKMSAYPMRVMKTKFATMVKKPIELWEE